MPATASCPPPCLQPTRSPTGCFDRENLKGRLFPADGWRAPREIWRLGESGWLDQGAGRTRRCSAQSPEHERAGHRTSSATEIRREKPYLQSLRNRALRGVRPSTIPERKGNRHARATLRPPRPSQSGAASSSADQAPPRGRDARRRVSCARSTTAADQITLPRPLPPWRSRPQNDILQQGLGSRLILAYAPSSNAEGQDLKARRPRAARGSTRRALTSSAAGEAEALRGRASTRASTGQIVRPTVGAALLFGYAASIPRHGVGTRSPAPQLRGRNHRNARPDLVRGGRSPISTVGGVEAPLIEAGKTLTSA